MTVGPIRGRDLRNNIKELGFEQGTVITLEHHLDDFATHKNDMLSMARIQNEIIDTLMQLSELVHGVQMHVDQIRKNEVERIDQQFKDIRGG